MRTGTAPSGPYSSRNFLRGAAGWCPPGMLGIGIGGTAEKDMVLAKQSLMDPIDIHELQARGPKTAAEELRLELFDKVNALGIGAQGLGGLTTVLDVKILDYPTHAASKPVAMIPNCAATRHVHFVLDGSGPAELPVPSLEDWPEITWEVGAGTRRLNLDTVTPEEVASVILEAFHKWAKEIRFQHLRCIHHLLHISFQAQRLGQEGRSI